MKYIITGGAGFIGSVIVGHLNRKGIKNIYIVDHLNETEKWKNLVNKEYIDYFDRDEFLSKLQNEHLLEKDDIVIHMGAISATTEKDSNRLMRYNAKYTYKLFRFCRGTGARFIYASSAATYGNGEKGYNDNELELEPLNMYGYSKYLVDSWIIRDTKNFTDLGDGPIKIKYEFSDGDNKEYVVSNSERNSQFVGLKFFNVYGPNEYAKGNMASVIYHSFNQIKANGNVNLFKSYKEGFDDGEQKRDFIYVLDILKVIDFFIENQNLNGIYNLGTGKARTFKDLATTTFKALGKEIKINYIDMPEGLKEKYQYFTEANMEKLKSIGYKEKFYSLEEGIEDYVKNYLDKGLKVY